MKLTSIAVNQTLVTIEDSEFYFSYNTCVAVKNKRENSALIPHQKQPPSICET